MSSHLHTYWNLALNIQLLPCSWPCRFARIPGLSQGTVADQSKYLCFCLHMHPGILEGSLYSLQSYFHPVLVDTVTRKVGLPH
ncbi:hypothetical protein FKM82_017461 [Ascaphus truei]